ncbi:ly6/PLAUR domain-containing protein 6 isoform X3 [Crotalus tigris]|uniref:ly6/PLAUR domain-containing protein 6 isoform X3 n=1 Tax=Crotalus tigris TaxID=88082 RepID=UPI00192F61D5|nr:ly6/PLAUR domain-containing protein 6 isoform X3 [Crotalus tigris]
MESWPTLGWLLLLSLIADCLKGTRGRDFTVKDIVYLHPSTTRYCYSQHTLEANGKSVSVTKRCVPLEDCLTTGCIALQHKGLKVCTSCCEGNICNLTLPRNSSDAIFSTTTPINHTQRHWQDASIIMLGLLSLFAT